MVGVCARQARNGLGIIVIPTIVTAVNFGVFAPNLLSLPNQTGSHFPCPGAGDGIGRIPTTTGSGPPPLEMTEATERNYRGSSIPSFARFPTMPRRQHLLLAGLLAFFVGIQFRMVESFTLNERSSRFVAAQMGSGPMMQQQAAWQNVQPRKVIEPPRWLGLALMSVGAVLTVKSLSMKGHA